MKLVTQIVIWGLVFENISAAAKVYVVIAADTEDLAAPNEPNKIGRSCKADMHNIGSKLSELGESVKTEFISGKDFTSKVIVDKLKAAIQKCDADDAVMFYYSGHGSYDQNEYWLQLGDGPYKRQAFVDLVKDSKSRLKIIISEACAQERRIDQHEREAATSAVQRGIPPIFRRLFLESSGIVDVASSSQGQVALTNSNQDDGALYTSQFCYFLYRNQNSADITWQQLISSVSSATDDQFKKQYPKGVEVGVNVQREQTPKVFALDVKYTTPELAETILDGPGFIDPKNGDVWNTKLKVVDGVVVESTKVGSEKTPEQRISQADIMPASDGTWMYIWGNQSVAAIDQNPDNKEGYWYSDRLGTAFFESKQAGLRALRTTPSTPGANLSTSTGSQWVLKYGDEVKNFNGVEVRKIQDLKQAVDGSLSSFSMTVRTDNKDNHQLTGSFINAPLGGGNGQVPICICENNVGCKCVRYRVRHFNCHLRWKRCR